MKLLIVLLQFTIMTYNVENLFDTRHDTLKNDYEFCKGGAKNWTEPLLNRKIHNIWQVVVAQEQLPAILGLCEVENEDILKRMTTGRYRHLMYNYVHHESNDPRGIDVAILYRNNILQIDTSFLFSARYLHREMLYARFFIRDSNMSVIHAIQAHLPSRIGGAYYTEKMRISAARAIRHLTDSIFQTDPNAAIIIMGDMNDNPTNSSMSEVLSALPTNLTVRSAHSANRSDTAYVANHLYNLCRDLYERGKGTYYRDHEWLMLDQIIVSGALLNGSLKIKFPAEAVVFHPKWLQEKNGSPRRTFKGNFYNAGTSDHFPVVVQSPTAP